MSQHQLSSEDKRVIDDWNEKFGRGLEALEKARQLSLNDYLVLYVGNDAKSLKLQTNSYGAPTKYKVVCTTQHGIPFIKKVNKKGNPVGKLYSCTGALDNDDYRYSGQHFEFRLDPDYADSILLDDSYDPAVLHKTKQDIFKSVTEHNKLAKVKTTDINGIVEFYKTVNIGDTLWTSHNSSLFVQDKKTMSAQDFRKVARHHAARLKGPFVEILIVRDKNGKVKEVAPDFFYYKALYRDRPRTYKELKI